MLLQNYRATLSSFPDEQMQYAHAPGRDTRGTGESNTQPASIQQSGAYNQAEPLGRNTRKIFLAEVSYKSPQMTS